MKKTFLIAFLILMGLTLIAAGCAAPETDGVIPQNDTAATAQGADAELFLRYLDAGNQFIEHLKKREQPPNEWDAGYFAPQNNAAEVFDYFFDLDSMYVSAINLDPYNQDGFNCVISGDGKHGATCISVAFIGEDFKWHCAVADYFAPSQQTVKGYMDLFRADDYETIAALIGEDYYDESLVPKVRNMVAEYKKEFDFSETSIGEIQLLSRFENVVRFNFTINGAPGALKDQISFEVVCGDGLIGPRFDHLN